MKFSHVAQVFNEIEQVSGRLKITHLLADLFKSATPNEAAVIAYLSLGDLQSTYLGTKFNFAEKGMYKVIGDLLGKSTQTVASNMKKLGDVGLVVQEYEWNGKEELTITQVNKELHEFLKISGTGSQDAKEKKLLSILNQLDSSSAKYVVRVILGKLRLGFSDMTLLDAFSWMQTRDKSLRKALEDAYNISADIGLIIKTLKEEGIERIEHMRITPGVPVIPAAAERMPSAKSIVTKLGSCVAQPKLDGFRLQVHIFSHGSKKEVRFFSRNLQDMSQMFPELTKAVKELKVKSLVAEGEAIAYDIETGIFLPFQETVKRRRKHEVEKTAQEIPLKLFFFDILYLNGKSLLDDAHKDRRKKLEGIFPGRKKKADVVGVLDEVKIKSGEQLEKYFSQNISSGLEGVVVKRVDSPYTPGKRNFNWVKLKREESGHLDDTIDCVILGYYAGHGKRASFGIGALLVGVYNKKDDVFETIAKIGTGLTDAEWKDQKKMCDKIAVTNKPRNVECAKELVPDVWVSPEIICLIRADEITLSPLHSAGATDEQAGFALRFPRIMGYRPDKSADEATTIKEIERLYDLQFEGKSHRNPTTPRLRRTGKGDKKKDKKGQGSIF